MQSLAIRSEGSRDLPLEIRLAGHWDGLAIGTAMCLPGWDGLFGHRNCTHSL